MASLLLFKDFHRKGVAIPEPSLHAGFNSEVIEHFACPVERLPNRIIRSGDAVRVVCLMA